MDIAIGKMRSIVEFYQNSPIPNDNGGTDDNFSLTLTTRGMLRDRSGNKTIENGQIGFGAGFDLYLRFQAAYNFNSDTYVVVDGQKYRINDISLIDQIKHEYKLRLGTFDH